jgi:hypothetical protein
MNCKMLLPAVLLLVGCSGTSISKVSGPEFVRKANLPMGSMHATQVIGTTATRAYIEEWRMGLFAGSGSTTVLWTTLDELPPEFRQQLKVAPWPRTNAPK